MANYYGFTGDVTQKSDVDVCVLTVCCFFILGIFVVYIKFKIKQNMSKIQNLVLQPYLPGLVRVGVLGRFRLLRI